MEYLIVYRVVSAFGPDGPELTINEFTYETDEEMDPTAVQALVLQQSRSKRQQTLGLEVTWLGEGDAATLRAKAKTLPAIYAVAYGLLATIPEG
ncbi:MAG: hypothetical protein ACE5HK_05900 [Candidatus Methylomirabilales bacterium]